MTPVTEPTPRPERNAFQVGFVALMILISVVSLALPEEGSASVRLFFAGAVEQVFYAGLGLSSAVALAGSYLRSATGTYLERAGLMLLGGQLLVFGLALTATPAGRVTSGVFVSGLGALCLAQVAVISRRIRRGERLVATLANEHGGCS